MTHTLTQQTSNTPTQTSALKLTFTGQVRSEWTKLWSLRSTYWVLASTLVGMLGLVTAIGFSIRMMVQDHGLEAVGMDVPMGGTAASPGVMMLSLALNSVTIAQLVIVVLGVLVITGEYSSGQIRSTFNANPKRSATLLAKAIAVGVTSFIFTLVGVALSWVVMYLILRGEWPAMDFGEPQLYRMFLGGGLYAAGLTVLAFAIGALLKRAAGAIATVFALLLVVPGVMMMVPVEWLNKLGPYLPDAAGSMIMYPLDEAATLGPWTGYLVLLGYVAVLFVAALAVTKGRDI